MSESLKIYYYILVFIGMLYAFYKVGINKTSFLIVMIFWAGLFEYLGEIIDPIVTNLYKILIVIIAISFTWLKILHNKTKYDNKLNFIFILFSISFWVSYLLYGGDIITMLSQYFYKFSFVFILYHYLKEIEFDRQKGLYIGKIILTILFIQILLSLIKLGFIGPTNDIGIVEKIVGSMSAGGAGLAVVIPVIALIFYWVLKEGQLKRKDWYIVISFIVIAFASAKRQPIVFFPLILFFLISFAKKRIKLLSILKYMPIVIILFIVGAKLNPSFNPENKVWGSFDIDFISEYGLRYYFGESDISSLSSSGFDTGIGRGAAIFYFYQPDRLNLNNVKEILFGKGRYYVAVAQGGRFTAFASNYGIFQSGLMGEAGSLLYSFGYLGTLLLMILAFVIINKTINKHIVAIIFFYYLWDFLFYYNQVVYSSQSAVIVLCTIFLAQINSSTNHRLSNSKQ